MSEGFWTAIGTMVLLSLINIVSVSYFYGRLTERVKTNRMMIDKLWKRVFNREG